MVQMKVRLNETAIKNEIGLYIPHGSDERDTVKKAEEKTKETFISHMVQMKEGEEEKEGKELETFISHMVQMKANSLLMLYSDHLTLYPTWFR